MVKTPRITETLMHRSQAEMRLIAELRRIALPADISKGELVALLAVELLRPESVRAALSQLDVHEKRAWNALLEAGGALGSHAFTSYFGYLPGANVRAYRQVNPAPPRPRNVWTPAEGLWHRGLLFSDASLWEQVYVPAEIQSVAGDPLPLPRLSLHEARPPAAAAPDYDLLGDAQVALSMMKHQEVKRVRGGELARKNLLALNAALSVPEDWGDDTPSEYRAPYLSFLLKFLHETGLVAMRDSHLVPSATAAGWLESPRHDQMRQVWRWYCSISDDWVDAAVPGNFDLGRERNVRVRSAVANMVVRCPVGTWISTVSFVEMLRQEKPEMLRSWRNQSYPYVVRDDHGQALPVSSSWAAAEGRVTRAVLAGPFRWMGLVATGRSFEEFRHTPLGAFVLGARPEWDDEPAPRPIIVQPNFEILAPAEARLSHLYRLEDFADLVKRDRIGVYTLTQDSLRRALVAGETADQVIDFLAEASGRAVPQNVAFTLREWGSRYGEVEIASLMVLTAARDALLDELRSSTKVKVSVAGELGPRAVAIEPGDVAGLIKRLRKAGYSPKVGAGAEAGASTPLVQMPESELAPLLAAALAVERRASERVLPPGLTARLQGLLSQAGRADLPQQVAKVERALGGEKRGEASAPGSAVRFAASVSAIPALTIAITTRSQVELEYYDPGGSEIVAARVSPVRMESRHGMQYLVATSVDSSAEELYILDHIRSVRIVGIGSGRR